jgi:hypothetical protein
MGDGNTSIGAGESQGGNENHLGDPRHTTLGEDAPSDEPPAGAESIDEAGLGLPDGPPVEAGPYPSETVGGKAPHPR